MKKIRRDELSEDAQRLLTDAEEAGGLVVEDGKQRSRVYAYPEPTTAQKDAAAAGMKGFQQKVQQSFDEQGVSESDLDQLLQEDD